VEDFSARVYRVVPPLRLEGDNTMKAYADPSMIVAPRTVTSATHIALGSAVKLGTVLAGLIWVFGALFNFGFNLFGVDLFASIMQAQWVTGAAGFTTLDVFIAPFGAFLLGLVTALAVGAIVAVCTAWIYNLLTPTEEA
jgi:hypothetical protein